MDSKDSNISAELEKTAKKSLSLTESATDRLSRISSDIDSRVRIAKQERISDVVVRSENIRELAKAVHNEFLQGLSKGQRVFLEFRLMSSDRTQYESNAMEFLSPGGILDTRKIDSVEINFFNYTEGSRISIDLMHSIEGKNNNVYVTGYDETWVLGKLRGLEVILSHCEKQITWPSRFTFLLGIGLSLPLIISAVLLVNFIVSKFSIPNKYEIIRYTVPGSFCGILSYVLARKISLLYPRVELITGPEYENPEQKKRKKLYTLLGVVIIPLVLSLLVELIKALAS